jgi:hypothetical protein
MKYLMPVSTNIISQDFDTRELKRQESGLYFGHKHPLLDTDYEVWILLFILN